MRQNQAEDFWARVDQPAEGCWPWLGAIHHTGYGVLDYQGRQWRAHRLAYVLTIGPAPPDLEICHRCDNRPCCRPDHLFVGTTLDNALDKVAKGRESHAGSDYFRFKTHCPKGHPYDEANTLNSPTQRQAKRRRCKACEAIWAANAQTTEKRRAQKREAQRRYRERHAV